MNHETVANWLDRYVAAWKSYDPQVIGELFAENALYYFDPFGEPVRGREAIVAAWLEDPDLPGTFDAHYEPVAVDGDVAVATGRSVYFEEGGTAVQDEFANVFLLRFDGDGRCAEYREWYMRKPKDQG